jgi:hypothetical protein
MYPKYCHKPFGGSDGIQCRIELYKKYICQNNKGKFFVHFTFPFIIHSIIMSHGCQVNNSWGLMNFALTQ